MHEDEKSFKLCTNVHFFVNIFQSQRNSFLQSKNVLFQVLNEFRILIAAGRRRRRSDGTAVGGRIIATLIVVVASAVNVVVLL